MVAVSFAITIMQEGTREMSQPALILLVRFKSKLPLDQVRNIVEERAPEFRALQGLQQKYYMQDAESGEVAGLYLWESSDAFTAYRNSELRASIAEAYQAESDPRIEVYQVIKSLRDDVS